MMNSSVNTFAPSASVFRYRESIPEQETIAMSFGRQDSADQGMAGLFDRGAVKICDSFLMTLSRSTQISPYLVRTAMRHPKLTGAVVLLLLAALAGTITYTGFLVVGVLAEYLGTGRTIAGLLLGALFARFPSISKGKLRIVGLLPKPVRRPLIMSLLVLCAIHFLSHGDYAHAAFPAFAIVFMLTFPWLRRAVFDRMVSSVFTFAGRQPRQSPDDRVIDGEVREIKDDR
jgi:hypothetical protein